uniref:Uncharacterized protein n=1 Tax=Knipowitschia caucasica TaxID=637954 RepID=A0AAV2KWS6_KNICA
MGGGVESLNRQRLCGPISSRKAKDVNGTVLTQNQDLFVGGKQRPAPRPVRPGRPTVSVGTWEAYRRRPQPASPASATSPHQDGGTNNNNQGVGVNHRGQVHPTNSKAANQATSNSTRSDETRPFSAPTGNTKTTPNSHGRHPLTSTLVTRGLSTVGQVRTLSRASGTTISHGQGGLIDPEKRAGPGEPWTHPCRGRGRARRPHHGTVPPPARVPPAHPAPSKPYLPLNPHVHSTPPVDL